MNNDEAARLKWWDELAEAERHIWLGRAARAGVEPWELKKATVFDQGVTLESFLRMLKPGTAGA